ncbi:hypothetical protein ACKWTF_000520 [Chironomus riparius]
MESITLIESEAINQEADNNLLEQNSVAMPGIQIDSAACEICMPSLRIEPSNQEPAEEMQDAVASRPTRRSAQARKVTSMSKDAFSMPAQRKRSRSTKGSRGSSKSPAPSHSSAPSRSRVASRSRASSSNRSASKSKKPASRGSSRSRSKSASKRSVSRRRRRT